jgi:hypothetical protein
VQRIWIALLLLGCGGSSDPELPAEVRGRIEIIEWDGLDIGYVMAHFTDAELNPELVSDGTCRVYQQPCLGTVGACGAPEGFSAGTLDITGLWRPLSLTPGWNNQYFADGVPRDVFEVGAVVTASASGDEIEAFSLEAGGVEPLESALAGQDHPPLGDGPATFEWEPVGGDARIRLHINVADVCHAGAHWLVLECDSDDSGALVVSREILDAIPAGYGGCGGSLSRTRTDVFSADGVEVELVVASADWFNLFQIR